VASLTRERIFAASGGWALGADGLQWILYRRRARQEGDKRVPWHAISFVASTKAVLERCMREKGVASVAAAELLAGLPPTFAEWKNAQPRAVPAFQALEVA
jgi:hypothetical protein